MEKRLGTFDEGSILEHVRSGNNIALRRLALIVGKIYVTLSSNSVTLFWHASPTPRL